MTSLLSALADFFISTFIRFSSVSVFSESVWRDLIHGFLADLGESSIGDNSGREIKGVSDSIDKSISGTNFVSIIIVKLCLQLSSA